jgi:Flp pilus assembly pilin Flp
MQKLFAQLWSDDNGALLSSEFLFMAALLVIGIIIGLSAVRNAVNAELTAYANALLALDLGYTITGYTGCGASTDGSAAIFTPQLIPGPTPNPATAPQIITVAPCP